MSGFLLPMSSIARAARRAWFFSAWKAAPLYGRMLNALAVLAGLAAILVVAGLFALAAMAADYFLFGVQCGNVGAVGLKNLCVDVEGVGVDLFSCLNMAMLGCLLAGAAVICLAGLPGGAWTYEWLSWIDDASSGACEGARRRWTLEVEAAEIEEAIGDAGRGRRGGSRRRL